MKCISSVIFDWFVATWADRWEYPSGSVFESSSISLSRPLPSQREISIEEWNVCWIPIIAGSKSIPFIARNDQFVRIFFAALHPLGQMNGDLVQCQQNFLFVFHSADLCLRGILGIHSKHGKKTDEKRIIYWMSTTNDDSISSTPEWDKLWSWFLLRLMVTEARLTPSICHQSRWLLADRSIQWERRIKVSASINLDNGTVLSMLSVRSLDRLLPHFTLFFRGASYNCKL